MHTVTENKFNKEIYVGLYDATMYRRLQNRAAYRSVSTRMVPRRFAPTNRVTTSAHAVVPGQRVRAPVDV